MRMSGDWREHTARIISDAVGHYSTSALDVRDFCEDTLLRLMQNDPRLSYNAVFICCSLNVGGRYVTPLEALTRISEHISQLYRLCPNYSRVNCGVSPDDTL